MMTLEEAIKVFRDFLYNQNCTGATLDVREGEVTILGHAILDETITSRLEE